MKVVLLAGGFGTRLSEYTDVIPKPMVEIGGQPILIHIMDIYSHFGHKDFYIALGYKSEIITEYFEKHFIKIDKDKNNIFLSKKDKEYKVNLVNTGIKSMTGGRLKRMQDYIGEETFMLTYGDGLSNININKLLEFHRSHGKLVTLSAVRPPARFGAIDLNGSKVINFKEKSRLHEGWINGGFFIIEPDFFNFINNDNTYLEREPLEKATATDQLRAFRHEGFWHCMDTKRDKDNLDSMCLTGKAPWQN